MISKRLLALAVLPVWFAAAAAVSPLAGAAQVNCPVEPASSAAPQDNKWQGTSQTIAVPHREKLSDQPASGSGNKPSAPAMRWTPINEPLPSELS